MKEKTEIHKKSLENWFYIPLNSFLSDLELKDIKTDTFKVVSLCSVNVQEKTIFKTELNAILRLLQSA